MDEVRNRLFGNEPERYWEIALKESAHVIVTSVASLRKRPDVLIICGSHNKVLAEYIMLESQRVGAHPHLWAFDEDFYVKSSGTTPQSLTTTALRHMCSLVEKSHVILWLSQFEDTERIPPNVRKAVYSFWDGVHEAVKLKPHLFVNLPSPRYIRTMGISYLEFLAAFINGTKVDYKRLRETGSNIAMKLSERKLIHLSHSNGTDLKLSIMGRRVGIETGTLEECYSTGHECAVDVPAGEVYVAPIETSANGILVVNEHKDHGLKELQLEIKDGRITKFKAQKGDATFKKLLEKAEGGKDIIGEFGVGTNHGLKPVGWSIYDEKAFGTAHIAIGNNVHLGGVNKASIHLDFVLDKPTIRADNDVVMKQGKLVE
jgi:leucyl aminopeptidase (aminopeptidase T)